MSRRIIFLHKDWQTGGVERTNIQWMKVLKQRGCEIDCVTNALKTPDDLHNVANVKCFESWSSVRQSLIAMSSRGDTLIICQSHLLRSLVPQLIILKAKGVKLILAERNGIDQYNKKPFIKAVVVVLLPPIQKLFNLIIVNSTEMANSFPFRLCKNCFVVLNPRFDSAEEVLPSMSIGETPKKLVFIGRWTDQKGIDFIKSSVAIIESAGLSFSAYCGESSERYQKPFIEDVIDFFRTQNVALIFCSEFEGYPNILVEARAMGIPIILSVCRTGVSEIIYGYENVHIFRKDFQDEFKRSLEWVKSAEQKGCDNGFIARHTIEESNLADIIHEYA